MKQFPVVYFFQTDPKVQYMFFFQGEELNVKNVLAQFPIKITSHHVRFKILVQDIEPKTYAWFDISNPNAKVPIVNDTVYVKLLQLSDISYSRIAKKMMETINNVQKKEEVPPVQFTQAQYSPMVENKVIQQSQSPPKQPLPIPQVQQPRNSNRQLSNQSNDTSQSGDLLEAFEKFDFKPKQTQSQPISQADLDYANQLRNPPPPVVQQRSGNNNGNLMEFADQPQVYKESNFVQFNEPQPPQTVKKDEDLFEFEVPQVQQPKNEGMTDKEYVDQRVEQAAEGLQKIWQDENDYNQQRQLAKEELDPKIMKWAFKNDVRNNLRMLLTNLNDVLWEGAGWQCSIGDLMSDAKVKVKYRQALLIVHPDKQAKAPPPQRYIAERVFYELNQAWNDEKHR